MVKIFLRRDPVLRGMRRYALQSTEQAVGCQAALANYHVLSFLPNGLSFSGWATD
ncbi:MAG: hypothetical protein VCF25_21420 [Candidatus Poribacteria bacterium]